ncbi:ABC transporter substrate-binding protein [soil metagenome]
MRPRMAVLLVLVLLSACAPRPEDGLHPWSRLTLDWGARREGALTIYANTGDLEMGPLLEAFRHDHPGLKVTFTRENSAELHARYLAEMKAGRPSADLVWSSAMDLQVKLINDGYAQTYLPPDRAALPKWAIWKNQGYGVTAEPIVFAYDRRRLAPALAPRSHAALRAALEHGDLKGPVATFDPARSSVGLLYYSQDRLAWADTLALNRAIGASQPRLYESTATLLDGLTAGDAVLGYNVVGSYALERRKIDPNLEIIFPSDYTLVMSRIAFISARAEHPNAARLFLDFLLSRRGQALLASRSLTPVRQDLNGGGVAKPPAEAARPIDVGPALLANLDQMRRARLVAEWRAAIGAHRTDDYRRVLDIPKSGALISPAPTLNRPPAHSPVPAG